MKVPVPVYSVIELESIKFWVNSKVSCLEPWFEIVIFTRKFRWNVNVALKVTNEIENENSFLRSIIWNFFDRRKVDGKILGFYKIGNCLEKLVAPPDLQQLWERIRKLSPKRMSWVW